MSGQTNSGAGRETLRRVTALQDAGVDTSSVLGIQTMFGEVGGVLHGQARCDSRATASTVRLIAVEEMLSHIDRLCPVCVNDLWPVQAGHQLDLLEIDARIARSVRLVPQVRTLPEAIEVLAELVVCRELSRHHDNENGTQLCVGALLTLGPLWKHAVLTHLDELASGENGCAEGAEQALLYHAGRTFVPTLDLCRAVFGVADAYTNRFVALSTRRGGEWLQRYDATICVVPSKGEIQVGGLVEQLALTLWETDETGPLSDPKAVTEVAVAASKRPPTKFESGTLPGQN